MTATDPEHRLTVPIGLRDHIRGELDAPLRLVEYGDYECPYCRAAYPIVRDIERRLEGRLCFAYRHFPIVNAHPHAVRAAVAAEAAGAQGRFWPMHDQLYVTPTLDDESLVRCAVQIGLDMRRFVDDFAEHTGLDRIREDMSIGARSGVNGTPTFFIGGFRYDGPRDVVSMTEALQRAARAPVR
jgi:protein-disulfide isomerase